jgi:hypothetical protein
MIAEPICVGLGNHCVVLAAALAWAGNGGGSVGAFRVCGSRGHGQAANICALSLQ